MFRFAHIEYLNLLYLIPVLVLIYWFSHRKKNQALNKFANSKMHKLLLPLRSRIKGGIKFSMALFAIILLILALANPQVGSKIEEVKIHTIGEIVSRIKSDEFKDRIGAIRLKEDKKKRSELKKKLPATLFCGEFHEATNDGSCVRSRIQSILILFCY